MAAGSIDSANPFGFLSLFFVIVFFVVVNERMGRFYAGVLLYKNRRNVHTMICEIVLLEALARNVQHLLSHAAL